MHLADRALARKAVYEGDVIGLALGFHLVDHREVGGLTQSDPPAQFVAARDQKMVERGLLPIGRRLTLVGAAVFEQTAFFDAVITPTESTTLVYRVERIDGNSRPRERKSGSHQALAELPQQFRFGHSPKPTLDQPSRGPRNLAVVHASIPLGYEQITAVPYGEAGAASTAARNSQL